jgi:hypothetical protein
MSRTRSSFIFRGEGDFTDARSDYARELAKGRYSQPLTLDNLLVMGNEGGYPAPAEREQAFDSLAFGAESGRPRERMRGPRRSTPRAGPRVSLSGRNGLGHIVDEELPDTKAGIWDIGRLLSARPFTRPPAGHPHGKFRPGYPSWIPPEIRKVGGKRLWGCGRTTPAEKERLPLPPTVVQSEDQQAVESAPRSFTDPAEAAKIRMPFRPSLFPGKPKGKGQGENQGAPTRSFRPGSRSEPGASAFTSSRPRGSRISAPSNPTRSP